MQLVDFIVKAGSGGTVGGGLGGMIPILLMLPIFYFLLIRPQKKQQKAHKEMLGSLSKGDEVITSSGIFGTIFAIEEKFIILTIADKTKIKIVKSYIATKYKQE